MILPEYVSQTFKPLEDLLSELRLHFIEDINRTFNSLNVYDLDKKDIARKVSLIGLNIDSSEQASYTPLSYKIMRQLQRGRSVLNIANFIAKTGGFLEALSYINEGDIEDLLKSSLERDYSEYSFSHDGFLYFKEEFKEYVSRFDFIEMFLPMGYQYLYRTPMYPRSEHIFGCVFPYWWLNNSGRDYGYMSSEDYDLVWTGISEESYWVKLALGDLEHNVVLDRLQNYVDIDNLDTDESALSSYIISIGLLDNYRSEINESFSFMSLSLRGSSPLDYATYWYRFYQNKVQTVNHSNYNEQVKEYSILSSEHPHVNNNYIHLDCCITREPYTVVSAEYEHEGDNS